MQKHILMLNGLQLMAHLPLLHIDFPGNVSGLLGAVVNVVTFDIIPTDLFFPFFFGDHEGESFNLQFQSTGYESAYLIENMGTLWLISHVFGLLFFMMGGMYYVRRISDRGQIWYSRLTRTLMWNPILLFLLEGYLELSVCSSAQIALRLCRSVSAEDKYSFCPNTQDEEFSEETLSYMSFNDFYGIIYFAFAAMFPFLLAIFYQKNLEKLDMKYFKKTYGAGYDGVKQTTRNFSKIFKPTVFLMRRLLFAISVVFFQ